MPAFTAISLGAGIQSSAMLALSAEGILSKVDYQWTDVVEFDAAIRKGNARANATGNRLLGQAFLHRSGVPLNEAPIDHVTAAEWVARQQEVGTTAPDADELEQGVPGGCSPWACRSSEVEPVQDDFGLAS